MSGNRIDDSPVAKALIAGQQNVTDIDSLVCLMRSPDLTLAGRSDLSLAEVQLTHQGPQSSSSHLPHYQHSAKEVP